MQTKCRNYGLVEMGSSLGSNYSSNENCKNKKTSHIQKLRTLDSTVMLNLSLNLFCMVIFLYLLSHAINEGQVEFLFGPKATLMLRLTVRSRGTAEGG